MADSIIAPADLQVNQSGEDWRDITGFDGKYAVSSLGRIRRNARIDSRKKRKAAHILATQIDRLGYAVIGLRVNRVRKLCRIHRLVACAFFGEPNSDASQTVNHKDGNKKNNHVSNLEWASYSQNNQHAWDSGLQTMTDDRRHRVATGHRLSQKSKTARIENGRRRRALTNEQIVSVRGMLAEKVSQREIAAKFGVSQYVITMINRGGYTE